MLDQPHRNDSAAAGGRREIAIRTPQERDRALRLARRNTARVTWLRRFFPIATVSLLGLYVVFFQSKLSEGNRSARDGKLAFDAPIISSQGVGMANPRYEGFNADGSRYEVRAARAISQFKPGEPVALETINGKLYALDETVTTLDATRGNYDQAQGKLDLFDGVVVTRSDGIIARLATARVVPKQSTVTSDQPVAVEMPNGRVNGMRLAIDGKAKTVVLSDGVDAHLTPPAQPQKQLQNQPSQSSAAALPGIPMAFSPTSGAPIDITARTLTIEDGAGTATFSEDVRAVQDAATMTSRSLRIDYARQATSTPPQAAAPAAAGVMGAGRLTAMTASDDVVIMRDTDVIETGKLVYREATRETHLTGGVRITRKQAEGTDTIEAPAAVYQSDTGRSVLTGGVRITRQQPQGATDTIEAAAAEFSSQTGQGVLTGGVTITSGKDRSATADTVHLDQSSGAARLTGNVEVLQGRNRLSGGLLDVKQNAGTMSLTTPAGPQTTSPVGVGRVAAHFYREGERPKDGPALQSQGDATGWTFRTDPSAPIDIAANRLDVDDHKRTAVFSGTVVARQGTFTINSDSLLASYDGSSSVLQSGASPAAQATTQLKSVVATGRVKIVSEGDRTATGDRAEYDLATDTVVLTGDVVLTQGRQIIRGSRLDIDVKTGVSRIQDTATTEAGGKQRMRAVFYPSDLQKQKDVQETVRKRAPEIDSWGAVTRPQNR